MMNPMPTISLPATWPQRLTQVIKTVWGTARRRPVQPTLAYPVAARQPVVFAVHTLLPPTQPNVVCLEIKGELNRHTFMSLIKVASAHYHQGRRRLLLDLRQTTQLELSGLFALLSIARLYSGQTPLDPEAGWADLHDAIEEITPMLGEWVKLIAPAPAVATVLADSKFARFFESHPDWESALAAFAHREQPDSGGSPFC